MSEKIDIKKLLEPVKLTEANKDSYRMPNDPADFDDAFIDSLSEAAKKLKEKNPDKDIFKKKSE